MTISRAARWAGWAMVVLGAWAAIVLALPFVGGPGRLTAVVGDPARAASAVARAGGSIVAIKRGVVLARSARPGFALRLYAAGAPLVLEGRVAEGCLALAKAGA